MDKLSGILFFTLGLIYFAYYCYRVWFIPSDKLRKARRSKTSMEFIYGGILPKKYFDFVNEPSSGMIWIARITATIFFISCLVGLIYMIK
jgi:hypothetical protein